MSLPELQRMLARLVTASDLREGFLGDPEGVAESLGWDAQLAGVLATLPPHQLRHYAESLVNKRCREAARCLPLTFKALGESRFRNRFREYAGESATRGTARHRGDAISFAHVLRSERPEASRNPAWLADLAAYEAALLRALDPRRWIVVLTLGHSPRDLAKAAHSGDSAVIVPRCSSFLVWIRLTRHGPCRLFRLSIPRS
jgi:hypothetical protein